MRKKIQELSKSKVFVSYASADDRLARALKKCLVCTLGLEYEEVFRASDRDSIDLGMEWRDAIIRALDSSQAYVIVLTPRSFLSPLGELRGGRCNRGREGAQ